MVTLNLYRVKEVGSDYIVLADDATDVRVTFAGGSGSIIDTDPPITKEENARFFKRSVPLVVGLETPVSLNEPRTIFSWIILSICLAGSVPSHFPSQCLASRSARLRPLKREFGWAFVARGRIRECMLGNS